MRQQLGETDADRCRRKSPRSSCSSISWVRLIGGLAWSIGPARRLGIGKHCGPGKGSERAEHSLLGSDVSLRRSERLANHHLVGVILPLICYLFLRRFWLDVQVKSKKSSRNCRGQTDVAHQRALSARLRTVMTPFRARLCAESRRPLCVQHVTAPYKIES